jgi:hypothetical protein
MFITKILPILLTNFYSRARTFRESLVVANIFRRKPNVTLQYFTDKYGSIAKITRRYPVLRSNDQGQKQPIKYLFVSKIKARCKPVKGREKKFVARQGIEPGTPALLVTEPPRPISQVNQQFSLLINLGRAPIFC